MHPCVMSPHLISLWCPSRCHKWWGPSTWYTQRLILLLASNARVFSPSGANRTITSRRVSRVGKHSFSQRCPITTLAPRSSWHSMKSATSSSTRFKPSSVLTRSPGSSNHVLRRHSRKVSTLTIPKYLTICVHDWPWRRSLETVAGSMCELQACPSLTTSAKKFKWPAMQDK